MSRQLHISARGLEHGSDDAAVSPAPAAVFSSVTVAYGRRRRARVALADFTLRIARGETLAFVGPTGGGKTTALRALAGMVVARHGSVSFGDPVHVVESPSATRISKDSPILVCTGDSPSVVDDVAALRRTHPSSTIVFAPGDPTDALSVADRVAVISEHRLVDVGTPGELWDHPPSTFTARFLGDANLIECAVGRVYGASAVVSVGQRMLSAVAYPTTRGHRWTPGAAAFVCIRPYDIEVCAASAAGATTARIIDTRWRGASTRLTLAVDGLPDQPVIADVAGRAMYRPDTSVGVKFPAHSCVLVPRT
ncbi:TOBE domain-containing protein [Gordonia sp. TBRC 11910]|uniref:TOBE domain-containing protein n=1 Tax=Gordonia asplenii TaxID=2725283 RepID=A0A848KNF6_9ACTN|nr:TOBE domain-containing protein [Gordonia asplenii]NMO00216.1 TOBE domain-containing protein [Gordonia asplenii]